MNLQAMKVTKGTYEAIKNFVYNNRESMTFDLKVFYGDVAGLIHMQLQKKAARRMSMQQVLERAYNIEKYVLAAGADSFETVQA